MVVLFLGAEAGPSRAAPVRPSPIKGVPNRIAIVTDPSWSLEDKETFVKTFETSATPPSIVKPRRALGLPRSAIEYDVLPPAQAATQVLGELAARPSLIPAVADSIGRSAVDGGKTAASALEELGQWIGQQKPEQRLSQLRALDAIRRKLYSKGLNRVDFLLWVQNHMDALFDGVQQVRLVEILPFIGRDPSSMKDRLFEVPTMPRDHLRRIFLDISGLPATYHHGRHLVSFRAEHPGLYFLPSQENDGHDLSVYIHGKISPGSDIRGQHNHVFIQNDLGRETSLSVRSGFVSARALRQDSRMKGGDLIILGEMDDSGQAEAILRDSPKTAATIAVPEGRREDIFLWLTGKKKSSLELDRGGQNLPRVLRGLRALGLLRKVYPSRDDAARLREFESP